MLLMIEAEMNRKENFEKINRISNNGKKEESAPKHKAN